MGDGISSGCLESVSIGRRMRRLWGVRIGQGGDQHWGRPSFGRHFLQQHENEEEEERE
jgi:hypothetical protein